MKSQAVKIATQKSNHLILAFENTTSDTSVLDTHKCEIRLLESPFRICALIPKRTCAEGHRIELYIIQNSLVPKHQLADIRKHSDVIKLSSIVVEQTDYDEERSYVAFELIDVSEKEHREIEKVILERQERFNELLKKFRSKN